MGGDYMSTFPIESRKAKIRDEREETREISGCPPAKGCTSPELTDAWYIAYPTIFATLYHRRASCLI